MRKLSRTMTVVLAVSVAFVASGCDVTVFPGGGGGGIGVFEIVTVRAENNTDFDVDPAIEFGFSENSLRFADVGILLPGEAVEIDIDCDDIEVLTTTNSAQLGLSVDFVIDPLPIFELGRDYFCGEIVLFEFVGNGQDFTVFVDAGGENIF